MTGRAITLNFRLFSVCTGVESGSEENGRSLSIHWGQPVAEKFEEARKQKYEFYGTPRWLYAFLSHCLFLYRGHCQSAISPMKFVHVLISTHRMRASAASCATRYLASQSPGDLRTMPPLSSYFSFLKQNVDFESFLQLPLATLGLIGLGQYESKNGRKLAPYLYATYTILILTTLPACTIFYFAFVDWSNGIFDPKASYYLAVAIWLLQATLASMAIAYSVRKGRFQQLVRAWNEHEADDLITDSDKFWARRSMRVAFCYTLVVPICFFIICITDSAAGEVTSATANDLTTLGWYRYGIKIGVCILFNLVYYPPQYLFFVVVIHVGCCWRGFGSKLREMAAPYDRVLEFAIMKHKELSEVVRLVNAALGFYAFAMFFTNVITVLSTLYVLYVADTLDLLNKLFVSLGGLANVIMVLFLASASMIKEAGSEVPEILYDRYREHCMKPKNKTEPEYGVETALVLERMRAASIGVSPLGVFTISRQFLVASFSIMASYYLAMMQFVYQGPAGAVCNCTGRCDDVTV